MTDEIRHTYTFITDTNVVMLRSHYEQLVKERDEAQAKAAAYERDWNKVRPSIEAVEEQERERCARICDLEFAANWHASAMAAANAAKRCAELIRATDKKP